MIENYSKIKRPKSHASYCFVDQTYKAGFGYFKTRPAIVFFSVFEYVLSNRVRQKNSTIKLYICNLCTRFNKVSRTWSTLGQSTAVEKNRKQNFAQFFKQKVPIDWWNKWLPEGGRRFIASNFAIFFHAEKGILLVIRNWWLT